MDDDVADADRGEEVDRLVVVDRQEALRGDRLVTGDLRSGRSSAVELPQRREVEHARDLEAVLLADAGAADEHAPGTSRHRPLDLEPDGLAEAPAPDLLLDGLEQVVRLVLLDRDVGVAGDPEQVGLEDLHAPEQLVEVAPR